MVKSPQPTERQDMIVLELPWPARELSPNARVHHMERARAAKVARESAYWLTVKKLVDRGGAGTKWPDREAITLSLTFHPPDKRRYDLDGLFSRSKSQIDGIADALGVNDFRFEFNLKRAEPVKGGKVCVTVESSC